MNYEELESTYQFQDYVQELLYKTGIPINCFASQKYNYEVGESIAGVEIKQDKKMKETGNIYIELYEKHYQKEKWVASGILRNDNTIFYVIGDYDHIYMFAKKQLKGVIAKNKDKFKKVETETSIGILIPEEYIKKNDALVLIEWVNGKKYEKEVKQTSTAGKE